jgi:Family of unknown function (DUF6488)
MKTKMTLFGLLAGGLLTLSAVRSVEAHPGGHDHAAERPAIDEEAVKARAKEEVERLIGIKKLEPSWKESTVKGVEKKTTKGRWEWLATLENPSAKAKKVLYVFLKPSGAFVAANFTGR